MVGCKKNHENYCKRKRKKCGDGALAETGIATTGEATRLSGSVVSWRPQWVNIGSLASGKMVREKSKRRCHAGGRRRKKRGRGALRQGGSLDRRRGTFGESSGSGTQAGGEGKKAESRERGGGITRFGRVGCRFSKSGGRRKGGSL